MANSGQRGGWLPELRFDVVLEVLRGSKEALLFQPRLPVQDYGERSGPGAVRRRNEQEGLAIGRKVPAAVGHRRRGEQPARRPGLESVAGVDIHSQEVGIAVARVKQLLAVRPPVRQYNGGFRDEPLGARGGGCIRRGGPNIDLEATRFVET